MPRLLSPLVCDALQLGEKTILPVGTAFTYSGPHICARGDFFLLVVEGLPPLRTWERPAFVTESKAPARVAIHLAMVDAILLSLAYATPEVPRVRLGRLRDDIAELRRALAAPPEGT